MTQNKRLIAITGNIGSGKSTLLKILKELGFRTVSLDEYTERAYSLKEQSLKAEFGEGIFKDGKVDRRALSKIVFSDSERREKLNAILHPAILSLAKADMQGERVCFVEVPLLYESDLQDEFDEVWLITADRDDLEKRVLSRDGLTRSQFEERLLAQISDDKKLSLADEVIINDGAIDKLKVKVSALIEKL